MISDALHAYAAQSQRSWLTDRDLTVGASEVGLCARRIYYTKNERDASYGLPRDADYVDGWGARTRGSVYEDAFWSPAIKARYGDKALFVGAEQRTFTDGFLSATPDGLLIGQPRDALAGLGVHDLGSGCILLDCKTADPRTRLDGPKPEHVFQVIVGMGLVWALTEHRPAHAVLSYTDASFWDEIREFVVAFDERVFEEAKRRARDVMLATSPDRLRPEGVVAGGAECERCPFTTACGQVRASAVPKAVTAVEAALAESIADLGRHARSCRAASEAKMDEARATEQEIREMLAEAGTRRLEHGGVGIQWSPVKGRPSYDNKAIREAAIAAGVDVERFSRVGDPTDRLSITLSEIPAA